MTITTDRQTMTHTDRECPAWCRDHRGSAHRTETEYVSSLDKPVGVHAAQVGEEPRIVIGGQPYTVEQAADLAELIHAVRKEVSE